MKEYKFKINGNNYEVAVNSVEGNIANVSVNGVNYSVEMEGQPAPAVAAAPVSAPVVTKAAPVAATPVAAPAPAVAASPAPAAVAGQSVTSPLPGVILSINVAVGDKVTAGQKVAVLEAMKMENDIESDFTGTVTAIHVAKGDSVLEGAKIVSIG